MISPRRAVPLALALASFFVFVANAEAKKPAKKPRGAAKAAAGMPEFPKEPKPQEAARLWQAGTLAVSRGDYNWAVKQFQGCLKAEPSNDGCRAGLKDAKEKLGWNPPKRRRKPVVKKTEEAPADGADPAAGDGAPKAEGEAAAATPTPSPEAPK